MASGKRVRLRSRTLQNSGVQRSKTGCRTCRIRRVKCDEHVPACRKCASSGLACEWFSPSKTAESPALGDRSGSLSRSTRPRPSLPEFSHFKVQELRGFEFFQLRTAKEMCPVFEFGFWESLALQLSRSDPAVLHAAVALGTLHEMQETLGMPISQDRVTDPRHRFAVLEYNIAIKILTERANAVSGDGRSARSRVSPLPACLIFTHIDLLRGHYESAFLHIRSAFGILKESHGLLPPSVEALMRTAFTRLDLQSIHFNKQAPFSRGPVAEGIHQLSISLERIFGSIAEGKERADALVCCTYQMVGLCEQKASKPGVNLLEERVLVSQIRSLLRLHDLFLRQCDLFGRPSAKVASRQDQQALTLFKMHARLARIVLTVCVTGSGINAYDNHLDEFEVIVREARAFVYGFAHESESRPKLPTLFTDCGIIFPLVVTILKCRDAAVRSQALVILESWPHREGLWDSGLAAVCARKVAELEAREDVPSRANKGRRVTRVLFEVPDEQSNIALSWKWEAVEDESLSGRNFIKIDV